MKKIQYGTVTIILLLLGLLLFKLPNTLTSQVLTSQVSGTFTTGTQTALSMSNIGSGSHYYQLSWNVSGSLSACTIRVDSSADGVSWNTGDVLGNQTCTSNGTATSTSFTVNYVRINPNATITGTGALTIILTGYATNPTSAATAGDGIVENVALTAGALTLANAGAGTILNNGTASAAAPTYTAQPTLGAIGVAIGQITYLGSTSGSATFGCSNVTCTQLSSAASINALKFVTNGNCGANGTAANPSVVACSGATSGLVSCSTSATTTCQVNTSNLTANSNILILQRTDTAAGTRLGVTCNTTISTINPTITALVSGTSFSFGLTQPVTNPDCFNYWVVD